MKYEKRMTVRSRRRGFRVRNRVVRDAHGRPRLSVFRSHRHIYAQIIDDESGHTLASASTMDGGIAGAGKIGGNVEMARAVGKVLAERASEKGIRQVVFDRGRFRYHGRIAALADAARDGGLEF